MSKYRKDKGPVRWRRSQGRRSWTVTGLHNSALGESDNAQIRPLSRLAMRRTAAVREFAPAAALAAWPGESPNERCPTLTPLGRNTPGPVAAAPGSVGAMPRGLGTELTGHRGG